VLAREADQLMPRPSPNRFIRTLHDDFEDLWAKDNVDQSARLGKCNVIEQQGPKVAGGAGGNADLLWFAWSWRCVSECRLGDSPGGDARMSFSAYGAASVVHVGLWKRDLRHHQRALDRLGSHECSRNWQLRIEYVHVDVLGRQQRLVSRNVRRARRSCHVGRIGLSIPHD
jgi:hypothetical protein